MPSRTAALALALSLALLAAPVAAASGSLVVESAEPPCILTGLGCFVLLVAEAVVAAAMECVQELQCFDGAPALFDPAFVDA